mmetsp:Transcript_27941/g.63202  ORF Transcript_27941/g.63202 Transcript_27941/m.63202 type:complete len:226 (-) Transcript_27941:86-763(-)
MPMDWIMDRFLCCCVNTGSHGDISVASEMLTSTNNPQASVPLESSTPHFLREKDQRSKEAGSPSPGSHMAAMNTARSTASAGSCMSTEEKEREKSRLQRLVKDFAKEAVTGIAVNLVNPETARFYPHFFQMDRYLTVFSLKPKDGSTAESSVQDFNVKDLAAIYKGAEVVMKAPSLGSMAALCVGLDTNRADRRLFFHFDEAIERDKFYTCLKILRMSVDISKPV